MILNYILQQAQRFERRHGVPPNVLYMNKEHYIALSEELPGLFYEPTKTRLGFKIAILSKETLSHPQVALIERQRTVAIRNKSAPPQRLRH